MRQIIKIIVVGGIFVSSFVAAEGQEPAKTTTEQTGSQTKKHRITIRLEVTGPTTKR